MELLPKDRNVRRERAPDEIFTLQTRSFALEEFSGGLLIPIDQALIPNSKISTGKEKWRLATAVRELLVPPHQLERSCNRMVLE